MTHDDDRKEHAMTTTRFTATGLTCGHCVGAVSQELSQLPGVSEVQVELDAAGASLVAVEGSTALDVETIRAALDEAGDYRLGEVLS
jgi:copper chaperone CopZ